MPLQVLLTNVTHKLPKARASVSATVFAVAADYRYLIVWLSGSRCEISIIARQQAVVQDLAAPPRWTYWKFDT